MAKRIKMYNPKTDKSKNGFIGFSWPTLFLAWIPMFARGDIKTGLELLGVQLGCLFFFSFTDLKFFLGVLIVIQIMMSISYNIFYTKKLLREGFLFNDTDELNKIGANAVGISVENCVFQKNGTSNLDGNSGYAGSKHCLDMDKPEDKNIDKSILSLFVKKNSKLSSSEIQKYGAIFFLTISIVLGYGEYSYISPGFVRDSEIKVSLSPTFISTLFSFIYIMTMTIRVKSEIIFCRENKTLGYYLSEWILLVLSVLVTAMFFSIFISSYDPDFLSFANIFGITGAHWLLAAVIFSFVGIRSLAGFVWIALILTGISNAIDVDKAMGLFGTIFAVCSIMGLSLQFIRLYAGQFGAMIKSDFMGARAIISGDVAEAKNTAGVTAKQAVNIGMTYVNHGIGMRRSAISYKRKNENVPEEKVIDLSDCKNRNNMKRLIHKRK